ncbi:hypothetical protein CHCC20335_0641 [Bacillus paralicheniformis]|nr:hypothetical protein CHCC20335_0641 [Bacillus paralicheniformis]
MQSAVTSELRELKGDKKKSVNKMGQSCLKSYSLSGNMDTRMLAGAGDLNADIATLTIRNISGISQVDLSSRK